MNYSNKVLTSLSKSVERLDKQKTILKTEYPSLPRIDQYRSIIQPNTLTIGVIKKDPKDLLLEINKKLASFKLDKPEAETSKRAKASRNINMIRKVEEESSSKILPIRIYNIDMNNHYPRLSPLDLIDQHLTRIEKT